MTQEATRTISLNSDIGEGYGVYAVADDLALMDLVSDVNIACGFHGGDPSIIRRTCEGAAERGLGVGAHFGFHDLRGFGRRRVDQPPRELRDDIVYQLGALQGIARATGVDVRYVKAHGALYHCALERADYAEAILDAILEVAPGAALLSQPGASLTRRASDRGVRIIREGFIDRNYMASGLLAPRHRPDALLRDAASAAARAVQIVLTGGVDTVDGPRIPLEVDSLCIHSDSPGAVEIATAVRVALERAGIEITGLS